MYHSHVSAYCRSVLTGCWLPPKARTRTCSVHRLKPCSIWHRCLTQYNNLKTLTLMEDYCSVITCLRFVVWERWDSKGRWHQGSIRICSDQTHSNVQM